MGCCFSSPHNQRIYHSPQKLRDAADLDEELVPIRYFGTNRAGSNLVPDDVGGLPSTHMQEYLATNSDLLLYEAEIDHGYGFRCFRLAYLCLLTPWGWAYILSQGINKVCQHCTCDEAFCWVRKEYSKRTFFRVYPNRIAFNHPKVRWPFGYLGCGSWNADDILNHPFDRGAFGFQRVNCGRIGLLCCTWPNYGQVLARHRCQCNGPLWNRMFTDCGGWWCEEWPCQMFFCTYVYTGLADADETAFACSIALQAYFEGRQITKEDMDKCLDFWRKHISEKSDPINHKRSVCCEPYYVPCYDCSGFYRCCHMERKLPYKGDDVTDEVIKVYEEYDKQRLRQIENYEKFHGPVRKSTLCRMLGCRRVFGRRGVIFCTEGCNHCDRKAGEPAPPFETHDVDDYYDAASVLIKVIGPPPPNVVIRRWRWDPEKGENVLEIYPPEAAESMKQVEVMKGDEEGNKPHDS